MNRRDARRMATLHLAEVARELSAFYVEADDAHPRLSQVRPRDRARLAWAYGALGDELGRRYDPAARPRVPEPVDPDQVPLFDVGGDRG